MLSAICGAAACGEYSATTATPINAFPCNAFQTLKMRIEIYRHYATVTAAAISKSDVPCMS